ncbi:putative glycerol-1-phosphate prenyltransferase [Spirosomataceae bacterium TFI 002]|nr:putative glycerol-1-phosphate prenyltransferase [Spirosomataceae bacterium TFI 002]
MSNSILSELILRKNKGIKSLAVLIDPDKVILDQLDELIMNMVSARVDFILVGGSLISSDLMETVIQRLKPVEIPVILFPGNHAHIYPEADGILYLSLISGRNADFLIGQHVLSAPLLKKSKLEVLPTGYILVDGGKQTTVSYISNTNPVPHDKPDVAAATAMAGELLGLQLTYLDCGSGAQKPVSNTMIEVVSKSVDHPIIVGGGIRTSQKAKEIFCAGADLIVVGTAFEENPDLLFEMSETRDLCNELVTKN